MRALLCCLWLTFLLGIPGWTEPDGGSLQSLVDRYGPVHPQVVDARRKIAFSAWETGDTVECARQQQQIIQTTTALYGATDIRTLNEQLTWADFLQASGQVSKAREVCQNLFNTPTEISHQARERFKRWQEPVSDSPGEFLVTERSFRYHKPGCVEISPQKYNGSFRKIFLLDARLGGFIPCPVCRPER